MTEITPISAYATTDGRLFTDPLKAQVHQYGLDIRPEVFKFLGYDPDALPVYSSHYDHAKIRAIIDWEVAKKMKALKGEKE
jgi:hypothetical protein